MPVRKASELQRHRTWVFYGRSASGKTTLASTFPGKKLLIDIRDEGTDSILDVKELDVLPVTTIEEIEEAYWWLKQNPNKYQTVILDTVTMWQFLKVLDIVGAKATKLGKQPTDWGVMTKQQWGEVAGYMKTWITNFRDLPLEVVFTAQQRTFNVGEDGENEGELDPEVGPSLSPSVMNHLCAAAQVIGCTFIRTVKKSVGIGKKKREKEVQEYCIRLGPSASYITKFRKPRSISLPDFLTNPTYEDILETIKGSN